MTEFNPKDYLSHIKHIDSDIRSRQSELDRLRQTIALKTSTIKAEVIQETRQGAFDERYMKLIEQAEEINVKIDELVDEKVKVSNEIDLMEDRVSRIILREKYINLKTFEEIAELLGYELSWTTRLHGKALKDFKQARLSYV